MPELSAAPSINDTRTQALLELIARLGGARSHDHVGLPNRLGG